VGAGARRPARGPRRPPASTACQGGGGGGGRACLRDRRRRLDPVSLAGGSHGLGGGGEVPSIEGMERSF
jgi:hypothetical protein